MTSRQDLDSRVTKPIGLDALYEKVIDIQKEQSKIARLQDLHGKRLEDANSRNSRVYVNLRDIQETVDRLNSRLDLMEEAQNAHGTKLDAHGDRLVEILGLLRKEQ